MKRPRPPISKPPARLRQRLRAAGGWRVWWEPETKVKALGFQTVELDADRPTWSKREAERLNALVAAAREASDPPPGAMTPPPRGQSIDALTLRYFQSSDFLERKPKTQKDYRRDMEFIAAKWSGAAVVDFTRPVVKTWYETLYATGKVSRARAIMRKLSILLTFAENIGWIGANPMRGMRFVTPKPRQRVLTWAEIDALLDAAAALDAPVIGCAVALSVFNGQRQTDVIGAQIDDFRDDAWALTRSKRGNATTLSLHPYAAPWVRAVMAAGDQDRDHLLYDPRTGKAFDEYSFAHHYQALRAEAAKAVPSVADTQFRDLRRTFSHLAREGGADGRDRADALGNTSDTDPRLSQTYNPPTSEAAARAIHAIRRPERRTA